MWRPVGWLQWAGGGCGGQAVLPGEEAVRLLAGSRAGLMELVAGGWAESQAVVAAGRGAGSSPPLKVSTLRPCL